MAGGRKEQTLHGGGREGRREREEGSEGSNDKVEVAAPFIHVG